MARWGKPDSQIDPFNAGDPILPGDDPDELHESCEFDGAPSYTAPVKHPDDYVAPSSEEGDTALFERFAEKAKQASAGTGLPKRPRGAKRAARDADGVDADSPERVSTAEAAPHSGTNIVYRILVVAAVVVLVGAFAPVVGLVVGAASDAVSGIADAVQGAFSDDSEGDFDFDSGFDFDSDFNTDSGGDFAIEGIDQAAGEQAITQTISDRLASVGTDAAVAEEIRRAFSDDCVEFFGCTAEEMGIDATAYAAWLMRGFEFSVDTVFCFGGYDDVPAEDQAFVDVSSYDQMGVWWDFYDAVSGYLSGEGVDVFNGGTPQLTEEQKARVRELLAEVMGAQVPNYTSSASFNFTYEDGSWVLDEEGYQEELGYLFGYAW